MDRSLIDYLPDVLKEVGEIEALTGAEQPEVSALWDDLGCALDDQFIGDATQNGVSRWESMLSITPKDTDTLDTRKFRILTRINEQTPYTYRALEQKLSTLCGEDGYVLSVLNSAYTITVRVGLSAKGQYSEVQSLLNRAAPANMIIDLGLLYNQYSKLSALTYARASAYTYEQLRSEVI